MTPLKGWILRMMLVGATPHGQSGNRNVTSMGSGKHGTGASTVMDGKGVDNAMKMDGAESTRGVLDCVVGGCEREGGDVLEVEMVATKSLQGEDVKQAMLGEEKINGWAEGELFAGQEDSFTELLEYESCVRHAGGSAKVRVETVDDQLEKEMQTPKGVAHMYEVVEDRDRLVSE
jgi:hypothetical protein